MEFGAYNPDVANVIFFLTDGEPNVGESNWDKIRENVSRKNEQRFTIFSLAIGSRVRFLKLFYKLLQ